MDTNFLPDLYSELLQDRNHRIFVLSGEYGIGKHTVMRNVEQSIRNQKNKQTIISIQPDEFGFALWPAERAIVEEKPALKQIIHDNTSDLNYVERLTKCFVETCNEGQHVIIFLYHIQEYSNELLRFIERLLRLLLSSIYHADVCFCCCLDTNEGSPYQRRSYVEIVSLFSRFHSFARYFLFKPWPENELSRLLTDELFDNSLMMSSSQIKTIVAAAMGNPKNLISIVEQMKAKGIIYWEDNHYSCMEFDWSVLQRIGKIPIREQYESLETPLRDLLRGSSVIGVEFEAKLLSNPLEFSAVSDKLSQLLSISRIIHRKVDDLYQFDTVFARLSIRNYVSDDELTLWNRKLGDYFWKLSQYEISIDHQAESLNSLKKSAFYYDEANEKEKAIFIYDQIVRKLMMIMQYSDAVHVLVRIRDLYSTIPSSLQSKAYAKTWLLQGDCHRSCSEYSKAISAYERYLSYPSEDSLERLDVQCTYYAVIYESGEVQRPLAFFRNQLKYLETQKESCFIFLRLKVLEKLSFIEETICSPSYSLHYNAALDIAKEHHFEKEYYSLLSKALIVHKGLFGIRLMESAKQYFLNNGEQKELAKVLCNIATELLLHGNIEIAKDYYERSLEIIHSFGGELLFVPLNGLGDYWCLNGKYETALEFFLHAFEESQDAFSYIAISINIATAYRKLGQFDKAEKYLFSAEQRLLNGDGKDYAILLPHITINKAILLYETGSIDDSLQAFSECIQQQPFHGRRISCLAAVYAKEIYQEKHLDVPQNVLSVVQQITYAEERLVNQRITLLRLSITE